MPAGRRRATRFSEVRRRSSAEATYGVEIRPLLVVTIKRLPQRTIESTLPTPGTVCPGVALQTPLGPSKTAVPLATSRSVQPLMVVGLVSGVGASFVRVRSPSALATVKVACVSAAPLSPSSKHSTVAQRPDAIDAEERFGPCGAPLGASRSLSRTIVL